MDRLMSQLFDSSAVLSPAERAARSMTSASWSSVQAGEDAVDQPVRRQCGAVDAAQPRGELAVELVRVDRAGLQPVHRVVRLVPPLVQDGARRIARVDPLGRRATRRRSRASAPSGRRRSRRPAPGSHALRSADPRAVTRLLDPDHALLADRRGVDAVRSEHPPEPRPRPPWADGLSRDVEDPVVGAHRAGGTTSRGPGTPAAAAGRSRRGRARATPTPGSSSPRRRPARRRAAAGRPAARRTVVIQTAWCGWRFGSGTA